MNKAYLNWSLHIECPKCHEDMNLVDYDADHDNLISTYIFSNKWDKLKGYEVTCPECQHEFEIDEVVY